MLEVVEVWGMLKVMGLLEVVGVLEGILEMVAVGVAEGGGVDAKRQRKLCWRW